MSGRYELWLSNRLGMRKAISGYVLLDFWHVANGIGPLKLRLPRGRYPRSWFALDSQIEVWRNGRLEGLWLIRRAARVVGRQGEKLLEIRAVSLAEILKRRIVAAAAGSAAAQKVGPADDVMRAIVREQFGSSAGVGRDISAILSVEPDYSLGPTVEKAFSRRNVLRVLQELAQQSAEKGTPIFFDVVYVPPPTYNGSLGGVGSYEFRCYRWWRGQDHRYGSGNLPVVLSADFGTLADVERFEDYEQEITVMYAAGRGLNDQRVVVSAQDDARIAASLLNWREGYTDARHVVLDSSLNAEAESGLREGQPVAGLRGRFVSTPQAEYGKHWGFGDLLSASVDGEVVDVRVDRVHVVVAGRREVITGELRSDGAAVFYTAAERIEWAIDRTAIGEMPRVTETPIAYGTPQAGSEATIADGWLSAAIARVTQIPTTLPPSGAASGDLAGSYPNPTVVALRGVPVENTVPGDGELLVGNTGEWVISDVTGIKGVQELPGIYKVPMAGAGGKIDDGWLNTTIARLSDLTWTNISGKPSTFTPSAHTHTKANITDLETITTTSTAGAIPKADGAGDLADAWIPGTIPRLAAANTFTVAQVVQVTAGTATAISAMVTYNALCSVATAAGFGQDHYFNLEADSGTNRNAGLHRIQWATAADATRKARQLFYCYDNVGARECLRLESTGAAPAVGFNGVAAVARQSLTALSMAVGTGDDSVADVGTAFNQATLNNNFRDLVNKVNAIRTILVNVGIAV